MKKSLLLTATMCAAFAVNAQDVTPTNWQFGISGFSRLVEQGFQEYSLTLYHGTY